MAFIKTINSIVPPSDSIGGLFTSEEVNTYVICKSPDKILKLVNAIEGGKTIHFISDGDWSISDLVMLLLKKYEPADLYFSTYALRETQTRQLVLAQQDGILKSVNMLIDYRAKTRTPEVLQLSSNNFNKIEYIPIHAKVAVIKSDKGTITICGSANWTNNPRIEYGCVSTDNELAEFHITWFNELFKKQNIFK